MQHEQLLKGSWSTCPWTGETFIPSRKNFCYEALHQHVMENINRITWVCTSVSYAATQSKGLAPRDKYYQAQSRRILIVYLSRRWRMAHSSRNRRSPARASDR